MRAPKPRWGQLYALLPLGAALLVAAQLVAPTAGWQEFTEGLASLIIIGAIALWVHANRVALALPEERPGSSEPSKVRVAYCPPAPLRRARDLAGIPHGSVLTVYSEPARKGEGVTCSAK